MFSRTLPVACSVLLFLLAASAAPRTGHALTDATAAALTGGQLSPYCCESLPQCVGTPGCLGSTDCSGSFVLRESDQWPKRACFYNAANGTECNSGGDGICAFNVGCGLEDMDGDGVQECNAFIGSSIQSPEWCSPNCPVVAPKP